MLMLNADTVTSIIHMVDETRLDKIGVDKMSIKWTGIDELGLDELGPTREV